MTAPFFRIYTRHEMPGGSHEKIENWVQIITPAAKDLTKKLVLSLYSIALVTDPFLWINISTGCQEVVIYFRLLKKTTS